MSDKLRKEKEKIEKQLKNWQHRKKPNLTELKLEVKKFNKTLKYHELGELEYQETLNNKKKKVYSCQGVIEKKLKLLKPKQKEQEDLLSPLMFSTRKTYRRKKCLMNIKHNNLVNEDLDSLKTPYF
ncbi:hypothetical protein [Microcystis sp. MC19]|uniref:hypothetical protein n=1 Tax=Microcystis sp. MC19 TaxID=1967666 RepID=UPI0020B1762D|nr:hypothetical protein [Microcystis sp. MC19]